MVGCDERPECPHCGKKLSKWETPQQSSWDTAFQYACFNDECPYFRKGWSWMAEKYSAHASYRYRYDPHTGETGPLPVWSIDAMKNRIIEDEENPTEEKAPE